VNCTYLPIDDIKWLVFPLAAIKVRVSKNTGFLYKVKNADRQPVLEG